MGALRPEHIPTEILALCRRLREAGYEAYLVGGAVRDHLRLPEGQTSAHDFDIATSARPEQVIDLFGRRNTVPTGIQHGTVTVLIHGPGGQREHVEVTTFRGEGTYSDGRRPDQVAFHDNIVEDLRRRDFTINAIAYDPLADKLVDPFGGREDLRRRLIRAVGDAAERFREDGLRTMRAVRLAAQLEFALDEATAAAIPGALPTLRKVSRERIRDELLKLLSTRRPSIGLHLMQTWGILAEVLPELSLGSEVPAVLDALPEDAVLRLGALLWPLGEGGDAPDAAARIRAVGRLRLASRDRDRVLALLAVPPLGYTPSWSDARVRRFLSATPQGVREDLFHVLRARRAAGAEGRSRDEWSAQELERRCAQELSRSPPLSIGELAIRGQDVVQARGLPPGPWVGQVLRTLLELVLEDPGSNTRETLLRQVHAMAADAGDQRDDKVKT
ncbi:MAG: hypothetical protein RMK29_14185 [Myxococcales bacterium]|nr:hypothetical protein [Myxococcales bacterium]